MPVRHLLKRRKKVPRIYSESAGVPQSLSFVDVRKAYFNGNPKRNLFMSFPRELGLPPNLVGRQVRCVYGTRDAGEIWEDWYRDCLEDMGLSSGVSFPCCFFHKERDLACVVHGDDLTCPGSDTTLNWYAAQMALSFEIKIKGRLGVGCKGPTEMKILNKIVRVDDKR